MQVHVRPGFEYREKSTEVYAIDSYDGKGQWKATCYNSNKKKALRTAARLRKKLGKSRSGPVKKV